MTPPDPAPTEDETVMHPCEFCAKATWWFPQNAGPYRCEACATIYRAGAMAALSAVDDEADGAVDDGRPGYSHVEGAVARAREKLGLGGGR